MRSGYPCHIDLEKFMDVYKPLEQELKNMCAKPNYFGVKCLLSLGLKFKDFKIGTEYIFLQSKKCDALNQLFSSDTKAVQSSILNAKAFVVRSKWRSWITCIRFLLNCRCT